MYRIIIQPLSAHTITDTSLKIKRFDLSYNQKVVENPFKNNEGKTTRFSFISLQRTHL